MPDEAGKHYKTVSRLLVCWLFVKIIIVIVVIVVVIFVIVVVIVVVVCWFVGCLLNNLLS